MKKNSRFLSPSLLSADFSDLNSAFKFIEEKGSSFVHVDVMDGHFVPNISIGAPVTAACKKVCDVPFDVHLMISNPLDYAEDFAKAGADIICFHSECDSDTEETINKILSLGKKAGLAIKPATPIDEVLKYLDKLSMVLVMTVEPGFGGQSFMESTMPKVEAIRKINPDIDIEVDGGINAETIKIAAKAGANVFVAGSAVFKSENPAETIAILRKNAQDAQ